jgi:hypothetical protein
MSRIFENIPLPPVFYHGREASYWREDDSGGWIKINETAAKNFVADYGYLKKPEGGPNSEAEDCMMKIQSGQNVAFVGPLAGYEAGVFEMSGNLILVTDSAEFIASSPGEWTTLKKLFEGMFVDGEIDQRPYFYGWVKMAMESFRARRWRASQMLAMAGEPGSGKSLVQNLATEMFGGRSAKPYQFMRGDTTFNSQLFCGEHLILEDESESVDIRSRRHFAAMLKTLLAARDQNCHAKNREALILRPIWRMSLSLNDDPERLMVLPPLDDDVRDKIIALKVVKNPMPMPTRTPEESELFWQTLVNELPAFLDFLEKWTIPDAIADARYGVQAYQNPEIVEKLNELNPEDRLLELIDLDLFSNPMVREPWTGTAASLERKLTRDSGKCEREAGKLLSWSAACGSYLARLAKADRPFVAGRVMAGPGRSGVKTWTIYPPEPDELASALVISKSTEW